MPIIVSRQTRENRQVKVAGLSQSGELRNIFLSRTIPPGSDIKLSTQTVNEIARLPLLTNDSVIILTSEGFMAYEPSSDQRTKDQFYYDERVDTGNAHPKEIVLGRGRHVWTMSWQSTFEIMAIVKSELRGAVHDVMVKEQSVDSMYQIMKDYYDAICSDMLKWVKMALCFDYISRSRDVSYLDDSELMAYTNFILVSPATYGALTLIKPSIDPTALSYMKYLWSQKTQLSGVLMSGFDHLSTVMRLPLGFGTMVKVSGGGIRLRAGKERVDSYNQFAAWQQSQGMSADATCNDNASANAYATSSSVQPLAQVVKTSSSNSDVFSSLDE